MQRRDTKTSLISHPCQLLNLLVILWISLIVRERSPEYERSLLLQRAEKQEQEYEEDEEELDEEAEANGASSVEAEEAVSSARKLSRTRSFLLERLQHPIGKRH